MSCQKLKFIQPKASNHYHTIPPLREIFIYHRILINLKLVIGFFVTAKKKKKNFPKVINNNPQVCDRKMWFLISFTIYPRIKKGLQNHKSLAPFSQSLSALPKINFYFEPFSTSCSWLKGKASIKFVKVTL